MSNPALGRLLGSGKEAEVFEYGAVVVKLYKPGAPKSSAFREAAILAVVEAFGLPVPGVKGVNQIAGRWGVTMGRAQGPSFAAALQGRPDFVPAYLNQMALLQSRVHSHPGTQLVSLKARLAARIQQATILGGTRQDSLLTRLAALPEGDRLCHGDFHPFNVLGQFGHETIVDWLDASCGDPAADVCRSYVLLKQAAPKMAVAYVDAYARVSGGNRQTILSWLPFVAAARLAEAVPNETDELVGMACR
jgi:hypothetical protein